MDEKNFSGNFPPPQSVEPEQPEVQAPIAPEIPLATPTIADSEFTAPELTPAETSPTPVEPPPPPPPEEPAASGFSLPLRAIITGIIGLAVVVIVALLIRRFLQGGTVGGPVTLTYWGLWEPETVMQTVIADFEREHPNVKINYEMQLPTQYRERLQAALNRGEGPDIFRFHNTWLPMLRRDLAPVPAKILSADQFQNTYYKSAVRDLLLNNQFYGLPLEVDGLLLYYNVDLLKTAGLNPPTTWDEFQETARALTTKDSFGNVVQAGAAIGTADNITHFSDILGLILYQNGTDFNNLTSEQASQALAYYTSFAETPNNVWDNNKEDSIVSFAGGTVAMIFAPSWQYHTLKALNPQLNFAVVPVPQLPGATPVTWASYWVEGVSARLKNPQPAFEFLAYLSKPEILSKLYAEKAKIREFGTAYPRLDMASTQSSHPVLGAVILQAQNMRSWYLASKTHDNGINDQIITYFKDAVNAILQGSNYEGALATVSKGVAEVLSQYGVAP